MLICNLFPPQALSSYNDLVLIEAAFMCLSRLQVILCKVSSVIYNKSFKDSGRNLTAPNSGTYLSLQFVIFGCQSASQSVGDIFNLFVSLSFLCLFHFLSVSQLVSRPAVKIIWFLSIGLMM